MGESPSPSTKPAPFGRVGKLVSKSRRTPSPVKAARGEEVLRASSLGNMVKVPRASSLGQVGESPSPSTKTARGEGPHRDTRLGNMRIAALTQGLHRAASLGDMKTVRELVRMGSDVHARAADGKTPLHYAASAGRMEIVKV